MKTLGKAFLAASLTLLAASAPADTPAKTQWVLATAKATGRGGEQFVSSLRIVNPNSQAATVMLTYLPQVGIDGTFNAPGDNTGQTPVSVSVPAGTTLAIEDVIGTKFGQASGAGGIKVTSDQPVTVLSRTFVANAKSSTGVPGIYGFTIPAQIADQAVSVGDTAYIPYASASPSTTSGSRTNFIMLNTAAAPSVVHVKLVRADGSMVGERDYTLGKLVGAQQTDIGFSFGVGTDETNLTLYVTVKSGGPVVIGLSIIDNAISSLNYAPPAKVFLPNNGFFGMILDDKDYGLSGRLDIQDGLPTFISSTFVLNDCPGGPVAFIVQGSPFAPYSNTAFTKNADGSYAVSGSTSEATWTGTIFNEPDGTLDGTITYARATGTAGGSCAGVSQVFPFVAARAAVIP